ncbi:gamma-glutamylcyclotransferase family protein [Spirosoma koreense]
MIDSDHLFVYGTLRPPFENAFAQYLHRHSQYVGEGRFSGQLYDLGNYPGAIYQPEAYTSVVGTIYAIHQHKWSLLAYLDEYEGIGPQFPQPTEYLRFILPIDWNGQEVSCWTYLYNLEITGRCLIESGDYVNYTGRQ